MSEKSEDLKGLMPTERKSTWRTAEERRMSDLTWVLQWQERRQGKKKPPFQTGLEAPPWAPPLLDPGLPACPAGVEGQVHTRASPPEAHMLGPQGVKRNTREKRKKSKPKVTTDPKATGKEEKKAKAKSILKQQEGTRQVAFTEPVEEAKLDTIPPRVTSLLLSSKASGQSNQRVGDPVTYQMLYGVEAKGKRLSMVPGNYARDGHRKSGKGGTFVLGAGIVLPTCPPLRGTKSSHHSSEIDPVTLEPTQWPTTSYQRHSITEPTLPDSPFARRRSTLLRDWLGKLPDSSREHKLKSLAEKGTEPKMQMVNMPKPEEVLRCRYLRLSKNNIRTLLKLCKDAGMNVDIHPHMVEDIDAEKVFGQNPNIAL
ncbi:uncharacterized protein C16orf78 homolog [Manis pentadactyla]|uniref:uncharacterized protein C16orf78 homolog n=1 Tax=Manis pentadactyla TaxID=143292 RepID=UPI00255CBA01|nr:uncharacterized protein C16orf78 homolog [Manis pentadactyla]